MFEDITDQAPCFDFYFRMIHAGPHKNFHYVVGDPETRKAFIVDPTFELDRIFELVERDGYTITHALFTHGHWDHIGGAVEATERGVTHMLAHRTGATHPKLREANQKGCHIVALEDEEEVDFGSLKIELLHTPGHQPESSCFLVGPDGGQKALFTGDTLFIGSCGRTDFPGGDTAAMFNSMRRLRAIAGTTGMHVMPGHHYSELPTRPLREEMDSNPALATTNFEAFDKLACLSD